MAGSSRFEDRGGRLGTRGAAVVLLVTFAAGVVVFAVLQNIAPWLTGLESVVLLVAGFVTVTLMLLLGAVVMTALGMRTPSEALGMPAGSIRALIAMVLILIFAIIGVLVFKAGTSGEAFESTGVTQSQIDAIRAGGGIVLEQDLVPAASVAPGESPPEAVYVVRIRPGMTQDSHDFGLQLLTTVSTLVVAVAGFYFGSRNVEQAITAVSNGRRPPPRPGAGSGAQLGKPTDEDGDGGDAGGAGDGNGSGTGTDGTGTPDEDLEADAAVTGQPSDEEAKP
jgi:hypothetical protein